jgi:hypothetical protein
MEIAFTDIISFLLLPVIFADVNEKYGAYLVPSRRFYDAVHTQSLIDGMWRGLIRVDLK